MRQCIILLLVLTFWHAPAMAQEADCLTMPEMLLANTPFTVSHGCVADAPVLTIDGREYPLSEHNIAKISLHHTGPATMQLTNDNSVIATRQIQVLPGWISLVPALLAIFSALLLRQVIPALFLGVFSGAWIVEGLSLGGMWDATLRVADRYLLQALVPPDGSTDHMTIALFTMLTGGMIGVISQSGGMGGIVRAMTRFAHTPRRGQYATAGLGATIFFDDYANTLIVGNTMRPLMDRLKVSREKLAYIVDSTAAPLACIALVTTWIGFQISLIEPVLPGLQGLEVSAFEIMLAAIPYSFYPLLALLFVFMTIHMQRDFGPMLKAEQTARAADKASIPRDTKADSAAEIEMPEGHALLALIPILTLILATLAGLLVTGEGETLISIFGSADPFKAMLWGSLLSLLVALLLAIGTKTLSLRVAINAMEGGLTPMLMAVIILTFAWAIADVNAALHTADYLISLLGDVLDPALLPAMIFIIAALTAFATGASWGTMGILMPLVLPLTWTVLEGQDMADMQHAHVLYAAVASVLAGAVWGDHCSPISDTTILSSIASGCDHIAHVRTQMPYALLVGGASLLLAIVPVGYGLPWWLGLGLGALFLYGCLRLWGTKVNGVTPAKAGVQP